MSITDRKECIRQVLKEAFPLCSRSGSSDAISHEDCVQLQPKLIPLISKDILEVLPRILEDLLDAHTSKSGDSEDVEFVVGILDVPTTTVDGSFVRGRWGMETFLKFRGDEEDIRSTKYSIFESSTRTQTSAISLWLTYARTWKDLELNVEEVDSALAYWKGRAEDPQEPR